MGGGKLSGKPDEMLGGNLAMYFYPINGGVVKVQIALCYGNRYIYVQVGWLSKLKDRLTLLKHFSPICLNSYGGRVFVCSCCGSKHYRTTQMNCVSLSMHV